MNNWDKYKRMQCNMQKAIYNEQAITQMNLHYQLLHSTLVQTESDEDVFNDTFLKITYKYNPEKDFVEQFKWLFNQLKGAYYRDDRANNFYQLKDECLTIPDFIPQKEMPVDTEIVNKFKVLIKYKWKKNK